MGFVVHKKHIVLSSIALFSFYRSQPRVFFPCQILLLFSLLGTFMFLHYQLPYYHQRSFVDFQTTLSDMTDFDHLPPVPSFNDLTLRTPQAIREAHPSLFDALPSSFNPMYKSPCWSPQEMQSSSSSSSSSLTLTSLYTRNDGNTKEKEEKSSKKQELREKERL